jgi:hypothetical protein
MIVGGVVSTSVTFLLTWLYPIDPTVGGPLYGLFVLFGVAVGVTVGSVMAFAADWRSDHTMVQMEVRYREPSFQVKGGTS